MPDHWEWKDQNTISIQSDRALNPTIVNLDKINNMDGFLTFLEVVTSKPYPFANKPLHELIHILLAYRHKEE